jgi:hypothetical protein
MPEARLAMKSEDMGLNSNWRKCELSIAVCFAA